MTTDPSYRPDPRNSYIYYTPAIAEGIIRTNASLMANRERFRQQDRETGRMPRNWDFSGEERVREAVSRASSRLLDESESSPDRLTSVNLDQVRRALHSLEDHVDEARVGKVVKIAFDESVALSSLIIIPSNSYESNRPHHPGR